MSELDLSTIALPELLLAIAGLAFLMIGVFRGGDATRLISILAIGVFLVLALVVGADGGADDGAALYGFSDTFVSDGFSDFMKVLVLLASAIALVMSLGFLRDEDMSRFEFPVLMVFATLGMMIMISANDLLTLYVGLELQSLSLYVLAAFRRDSLRASEAGLKYFVLGALSSGMLLYGASLVYGFAGSTNYQLLAANFVGGKAEIGAVVGLVFVIAGLAFKISAVPFHMWTPDVYEGAPTPVTAFFALAPKVAAFGLLIRLLAGPFIDVVPQWQQVIIAIAVASMALGAFAAIAQSNIKRLMAYSSIANMGFALVGLAAGSQVGISAVMSYLAIYVVMTAGAFAVILSMRVNGQTVEGINDLAGLSRTNPAMALAMAVFMFSMAGIPPMAGFFAKLVVFQAAVAANLYTLAVLGVLSSVVGAYYYLRIIKIMYFDEPVDSLDPIAARGLAMVIAGGAVFTLLFFLFPGLVMNSAAAAASSLFGG